MRGLKLKSVISSLLAVVIAVCIPSMTRAKAAESSAAVNSGNKYPIVMVHGLFGWGGSEVAGINYWGGSESLREKLQAQGYQVFTPSIGPLASNWDRACELYAYIKGGVVDYGEAHSKKYGHARYGRTYPGVYPQFGTKDASGNIQKIHLIGHSMGGQTSRLLVQLLENGSPDEIAATTDGSISPLFTGNKSWVSSVTTIATPHDGSQEAHAQYELEPFTHQMFASLAAGTGIDVNSNDKNLDLKMDQWGLKRESGESYLSYFNRVMNSNIWQKTNDLSLWDLTPEGARELNTTAKAQSDVYYFSLACVDTHEAPLTHFQVPDKNMNTVLLKSSVFMGMYTNNISGDVKIDKTWWKNDGIVSLVSAISPRNGSTDKVVGYNGTPQKGVWNYLGQVDNTDHLDIVQMKHDRGTLEQRYYDIAKMLANLEN
ncbi:MAG TPA: lipase [Ruminiclostridium sp.]|nr:lipase [Ruminiclostridium sp.]